MPWDVSYSKELALLILNFNGDNPAEAIFEAGETIIRESRRIRVYKFLVVATDFKTDSRPSDIFKLPYEYHTKWGLHPTTRIGLLEPVDLYARQIVKFYEVSSRNLGWEVKVFGNKRRALKWLRESE